MKLLSNENNPEALKIIIAGKLSKQPVEIVFVPTNCSDLAFPKRLPQLVVDGKANLFSSNSAAKFLCPPAVADESAVNYYLDLEAAVLQPLTSNYSSRVDEKIIKNLEEVLTDLDKALKSKNFLVGVKITVADVSIWSTLYPLFTDAKKSEELLNSRLSLKSWFERIQNLSEIKDAVKTSAIQSGVSSLTNLLAGHWFPSTNLSKSVPTLEQNTHSESPSKEALVAVSDIELEDAIKAWTAKETIALKPTVCPVLPVKGEKNVLITSALPYVNNVPHLGNIIGCVLSADVFARYCRLRNYNTVYICGTDEYGTATETKALEEGLTPQQICDKYFKIHDAIYKWFDIKFDSFGRTTTPEQTETCQEIFTKLNNNGFIMSDSVEQLLCETCDRYLADRFVEGTCPRCTYEDARGDQCDGCGHLINATELIKPRCKICQQTPVVRYSKQFFLDFPKLDPMLREFMSSSSPKWSHNAREIAKAWINDGLKPRCITRDLKWGIPVPLDGFRNKVFYVWFDAPIGYISITKRYTDKWLKWWKPDEGVKVDLYQFMAKDNVPFHSIMFPACLLGTKENYTTLEYLFATEYLNYEDGKFSKSRGVGVFGTDAQDTGIPADIWRFYLLYVRPETQDSNFSWVDLAIKNNSELLNILGNFVNRALVFVEKNYNSKIPEINLEKEDYQLLALINRELVNYISMLEKGKLRDGIRHMLSIARLGNQYMQASQPWVLFKGNAEEQKRGATVVGLNCNISCLLSVLLSPYMPSTAEVIQKQLNAPKDVNLIVDKFRIYLPAGHLIGKPSPLFTKIEIAQIEKLKQQFSGRQKSKTPDGSDRVKSSAAKSDPNQAMDVASLEAAVAAQGDLVRKMKSSGKEKSEWQPEVAILLDLKRKLATAQANAKESTPQGQINQPQQPQKSQPESKQPLPPQQEQAAAAANGPSGVDIEKLEAAISEQGNTVRKLKESGADRSLWQPQLNVLLEPKKQLADLQGTPAPASGSSKKNKKKK